jgi:hypothetical protein
MSTPKNMPAEQKEAAEKKNPTPLMPAANLVFILLTLTCLGTLINLYYYNKLQQQITPLTQQSYAQLNHKIQQQQTALNAIQKALKQTQSLASIWTKIYFATNQAALQWELQKQPKPVLAWLNQAQELLTLTPTPPPAIKTMLNQYQKRMQNMKPNQINQAIQQLNHLKHTLLSQWPKNQAQTPPKTPPTKHQTQTLTWQQRITQKFSQLFLIHHHKLNPEPWQNNNYQQVLLTQACTLIDQTILALNTNQAKWFAQTTTQLNTTFATQPLKHFAPTWQKMKQNLNDMHFFYPNTLDFKPLLLLIAKQQNHPKPNQDLAHNHHAPKIAYIRAIS